MPKLQENRRRWSTGSIAGLLCVALVSACSGQAVDPIATYPSNRPPVTSTVRTPLSLATSSVDLADTLQPTEIQAGGVLFDPMSIDSLSNTSIALSGFLVIDGVNKQVLDLSSMSSRQLSDDEYPLGVSPDHDRLAILGLSDDRQSDVLIIEDALGEAQESIRLDPSLTSSINAVWLDNRQLMMNVIDEPGEPQPAYDIAVVNVDNGATLKLASDYPGLTGMISGPAGTMHFGNRTVAYDPSLQLVLYPKTASASGYSIVLWDKTQSLTLAEIEDEAGFGNAAIWTSDGRQVAIPVWRRSRQPEELLAEWYLIGRLGEVRQLTSYVGQFDSMKIYQPSWSPDGTQIAFWLDAEPSPCPGINFAILAVKSRETTDYCIPRLISSYSGPPVWSSDGKYLALASDSATTERSVVIVSILDKQAVRVPINGNPVGWMR